MTSKIDLQNRIKPILMIPVRRCGSHALRLRLNNSPDFYSPYPLHIVDYMPLLDKYDDLNDDRNYFHLIIDIVGLQTASMVKWKGVTLDPVQLFEKLKYSPRSIHAVCWEILFEAGRMHNASVIMDKSMDSVHYADELMALMPDISFLNLVRDPRAQISSMNQAIIHEWDSILNAHIWVKAHAAALDLAERYPDRVLTIRFEDFIADESSVLAKVCDFIGIEFIPQMLDINLSEEAQQISRLSALWKSNASSPMIRNIDKFKYQLSEEDVQIIESLTGKYMDHYGYERTTTSSITITPEMIHEREIVSNVNRGLAWQRLSVEDNRDYQLRRFRADYIDMVRYRLER